MVQQQTLVRLFANPWFLMLMYALKGAGALVVGPMLILLALGALGAPLAISWKTVLAVVFLKWYAVRLFGPSRVLQIQRED